MSWPFCIRETGVMGKGVFATRAIEEGQIIFKVQQTEFITYDRLFDYHEFYSFQYENVATKRALFSYFLAAISVLPGQQGNDNIDIIRYIDNLPPVFDGLIHWSLQQLEMLDNPKLVEQVIQKKSKILEQYLIIKQRISQIVSNPDRIGQYRLFNSHEQFQQITEEVFLRFYSALESRNVYYRSNHDPDSDAGALVPLLQMFNHSHSSQCRVETGSVYTVSTIKPIAEGQQIYVNYGTYDEDKFLTVYGFLPSESIINQYNSEQYRKALASAYRAKCKRVSQPQKFVEET